MIVTGALTILPGIAYTGLRLSGVLHVVEWKRLDSDARYFKAQRLCIPIEDTHEWPPLEAAVSPNEYILKIRAGDSRWWLVFSSPVRR